MKDNLLQAVRSAVIAFNARLRPLVDQASKLPGKIPVKISKDAKRPRGL